MPSPRPERGRLVGAAAAVPTRPGSNNWAVAPSRSACSAMLASTRTCRTCCRPGCTRSTSPGRVRRRGIWLPRHARHLVRPQRPRRLGHHQPGRQPPRPVRRDARRRPLPRQRRLGAPPGPHRDDRRAWRPDETITIRSTSRGPLVDEIVPLAPEPGPVASRPPSASAGPARTSSTTPRPSST